MIGRTTVNEVPKGRGDGPCGRRDYDGGSVRIEKGEVGENCKRGSSPEGNGRVDFYR